ncbi:MAG: DUF1549 domain-containing protein [Planctomycetes bacterium]|nr:DUF1549 domain-containing protein [Planctomycetota bacterium]
MRSCLRWFLLLSAVVGGSRATVSSAAGQALRQVIDAEVQAAWQREKLTPAPRADDAAFLRRIYLDLLGTIPTYEETKAFLADGDAAKRGKLIDRLLDDPRFALHQRDVWDLVLFGRNPAGYDATRRRPGFKKWLAEQFARNVPFDRWAREVLLGREEGTELYHVQFRSQPEEATVAVSRIFLGTQLQCARCHDHPYESWTQHDFYGMAAFFVRLVVLDPSGKKPHRIAEKSTGEVLFSGSAKDQKPGRKGEPIKAKFLSGKLLDEPPVPKDFKEPKQKLDKIVPPLFSRKEKLAEWVTSRDNPFFARAVANRVWAQFLGRGLVHPVDDLSSRNQPSHPALLKALTDHVLAEKFDLKKLIRELVNSETYQLASTGANTEALPRWFERARVRPLSAEELLAALPVAAGQPASFKHGGDTIEYFTRYFGEPHDGQGNFQGSLFEHLFMNNADNIRRMLSASKGNLADTLIRMKEPAAEKVDRLFLSVLSRPPSAAERERFVQHLSSDAKMTPALIDEAIWALVSCAEFRFNH